MKKIIFLVAILCAPIQILQLAHAQQDNQQTESQKQDDGCQLSESELPMQPEKPPQIPKPRLKKALPLQPQALQSKPQQQVLQQLKVLQSKPRLQTPLPQNSYQAIKQKPKKPRPLMNSAQPKAIEKPAQLKIADKKSINWSGLYIGGRAGSASSKSKMSSTAGCPTKFEASWICSAASPGSEVNLPVIDAAGSGVLSDKSIIGGLQLGYDIKKGNIVFGPKIDISRLKINSSRSVDAYMPYGEFAGAPINIGSSINTNWLVTAQGRVGIVSNNFLFYTTAGLAMIDLKVGNFYSDAVEGSEAASRKSWKTGIVVGGGIEWALDGHWSLVAEYTQADFGKSTVKGFIVSSNPAEGAIANPLDVTARLTVKIATVGLNYRF